MNPAEEIVKYWLQQQGYFVQSSVRVPNGRGREIDILAIHEKENKRRHIEVSVAVHMQAIGDTVQTLAERFSKKFTHETILSEAHRRFYESHEYTREFVVGEVKLGGIDVLEEFIEECKKYDFKIIPFSKVLKEVVPTLGGHNQLNPIIKTIQLCNKFLCENPS